MEQIRRWYVRLGWASIPRPDVDVRLATGWRGCRAALEAIDWLEQAKGGPLPDDLIPVYDRMHKVISGLGDALASYGAACHHEVDGGKLAARLAGEDQEEGGRSAPRWVLLPVAPRHASIPSCDD